jgi:hypothetical protein
VRWHELRRALEREERFPAFLNALQKMVKKRPAMKKGSGRGGARKRITF